MRNYPYGNTLYLPVTHENLHDKCILTNCAQSQFCFVETYWNRNLFHFDAWIDLGPINGKVTRIFFYFTRISNRAMRIPKTLSALLVHNLKI